MIINTVNIAKASSSGGRITCPYNLFLALFVKPEISISMPFPLLVLHCSLKIKHFSGKYKLKIGFTSQKEMADRQADLFRDENFFRA